MPRALILSEPPATPEALRIGLLGQGYNVVDEIDDPARLEERKLVERAKGILMQSKNMSEEAAYSALRSLAMEKKQKLGFVAEQVITAARLLA